MSLSETLQSGTPWQVLDVGSIWMREFASALAVQVPTVAWEPTISNFGHFESWLRSETSDNPPLTIRHFPLQRGYARSPLIWLAPFQNKLLKTLITATSSPRQTPLICSTPFYAPLAERWPGPVVYYSTDLTFAYHGLDSAQVNKLDARMCKIAAAVCPNSRRIADYFVSQAQCPLAKITIIPNATRESNVAPAPLLHPGSLPPECRDLPRPIAGVIGNLAGNMDWLFIAESIRLTPHLNWLFVGPISMPIEDPAQSSAREWVRQHALFVGPKPYGELQAYARAFDVAILPYQKKEPTYSGSSTRFYEHLAACRPMIATRGFAELLEKPPLITLVDTAPELRSAIESLQQQNFTDGLEAARWRASKVGTWEERARTIRAIIAHLDPLHQLFSGHS